MAYKNKLGLRRKDDSAYSEEHPIDIDSLLEFSNCIREMAGIDTRIKTEPEERGAIANKVFSDLNYLDNFEGRKELATLMLATIKDTDNKNNTVKLPANNALLLIFRLMDAMTLAIENIKDNPEEKKLFTNQAGKSCIKESLNKLYKNISQVMALSFIDYGTPPSEYLRRFDDHKLWQNSLSQKEKILSAMKIS